MQLDVARYYMCSRTYVSMYDTPSEKADICFEAHSLLAILSSVCMAHQTHVDTASCQSRSKEMFLKCYAES